MGSAEANARGGKTAAMRKEKTNGQGSGKLGLAFNGGNGGPAVDRGWDECDPRHIVWVLVAISALGGAVTYGRSRDRSALSVTLMLDGERNTVWIAPGEDIEMKLSEIAEKLEALA